MMHASVIIPVYNVSPELVAMTERNIWQMRDTADLPLEVIVIDNGSPHRSALPADVSIRWSENRGIASAWNAGMAMATGDPLVIVNNDVETEPHWDRELAEAAMAGPGIMFPFTDHGNGRGFVMPDTGGVAGWCFAMSRATQQKIGTFDEGFNPAFYEDTDYWHRAWQKGIALTVVPSAKVRHVRRTTAKYLPDLHLLFAAHRLKYAWKWHLQPDDLPPFYNRVEVWRS